MSEEQQPKNVPVEQREIKRQKWEYCVLRFTASGLGLKRVLDFTDSSAPNGYRRQEIKSGRGLNDGIEKDYPIIASLGDNGWEMIDSGSGSAIVSPWFYFKRLRTE